MAEIIIRISDRAQKIAAILFVGIVLVSTFFYLWSSGVFEPKYQLRVYVPEASDLAVHGPVRVNGVRVGSVRAIKPAEESASPERRIELVLRIDKRYQSEIRSDSSATIVPESPLGGHYLSISRGFHGNVVDSDGEVRFTPVREMSLDSMKGMLDCLQTLKNSADNKSQAPPPPPSKP
jgi:phospholipid/cholesterol/gamma-HCH transport system substrate-binding protein